MAGWKEAQFSVRMRRHEIKSRLLMIAAAVKYPNLAMDLVQER